MASFVHKALLFVFPGDCFETMFIHHEFLHPECSRLVLSRLLGLGIILGSVLVKVPQIVKIHRGRSGVGVSIGAQALELTAITATMSYSVAKEFPFAAWGETLFLALQTAIVIVLILHYGGSSVAAAAFLAAYGAAAYALCAGFVPLSALATLQATNIPTTIVAKALQLWGNYAMGSTGQLSVVTVFLQFAGSLARIFTTLQETSDQLMALSYVVAALMNGLVFAQILVYWGVTPKKKLH